jgi:hypothetical protein
MASELKVNTLKDASGNNSVAMSTVAEGSAKSWIRFNGSGTVAIDDSFNAASLTDHGTGQYTYSYTNSMGNANYTISLFARDGSYDRAGFWPATGANTGLLSTTSVGGLCSTWTGSGNWSAGTDAPRLGITVHGDLA